MSGLSDADRCPDCGIVLTSEPGIQALCPPCLLSLAVRSSASPWDENEVLTAAKEILGDRYQVREVLGRGGMGEVFRAFDLKLRVDVALKAVRAGRLQTARGQEMLRGEVRAARAVVSPNVCRIFDLVVEDGQELVSMEYIDGSTLSATLRERGPFALQECREVASQFLSGLDAIHQAGLVHRDFKPENVMITRAGRVVVMDFGLAKGASEEWTSTIAGTAAYMPPEQSRGEGVDARADVYAAGVVLSEMLTVGADATNDSRQAVWRAVREDPPRVPEGPWAPVLQRALAATPQARYPSARALARALEEVTLRLPAFEGKRPYPGLASFTEGDAEYFFGREVEVEAVWKKLKRPRLLALIGPSGAGKSSFLRAGLLPTLPGTWKAVVATPGGRPFQSLAQALAPGLAGDATAVQALLGFEDEDTAVSLMRRFREHQEQVLVVLDQFEELFTLNPSGVQDAFARLLGRLVIEADVHVILSLRDDFLFRCNAHPSLVPAFSDLTPLGALSESALRRALVQPALACGYRFEDDPLIEEMVGQVNRERGALPLLAFAASRLWERRDRERGLLTRDAYQEIGGVAGALAQHAEATLDSIGPQRLPLVRELFRNLVTSQGTRAVREQGELLSVFEKQESGNKRSEAEIVLSALVDARLLTAYERAGDGGESHLEVEIIHESLLSAWPRLVRWQTQEADGAQVRDQLRQAAHVWQDRGRPEDLLWSGTAYRDLALWRERYAGGLSATEEAFAAAAARRADRKRTRRQLAVGALLAAVATVAVTTFVLWRHSEVSLRKAEAETFRAEAGKLLAMGERELQRYPTGALAYTLKSLELADTDAGRLLALRVLQRAPVARLARMSDFAGSMNSAGEVAFSPNAEWVAVGGNRKAEVIGRDGGKRLALGEPLPGGSAFQVAFGTGSDVLVTSRVGDVRIWSIPEGRELRRWQIEKAPSLIRMARDGFVTVTSVSGREIVRSWPMVSGEPRLIGSMDAVGPLAVTARVLAFARGRAVYRRSLENWTAPPRLALRQPTDVRGLALTSDDAIVTSDPADEIRMWPATTPSAQPSRILRSPERLTGLGHGATGRWFYTETFQQGYPTVWLFDLMAPPWAEPLALQKGDTDSGGNMAFDPTGRWLATTHGSDVAFWPLGAPRPRVHRGLNGGVLSIAFAGDSKSLVSMSADGSLLQLPLVSQPGETRTLHSAGHQSRPVREMALDPRGRLLALAGPGRISLIRLDGGVATPLRGVSDNAVVGQPMFAGDGQSLAAGTFAGPREEKVVRVWDVDSGAVRVFGPLPGAGAGLVGGVRAVRFAGREHLLVSVLGTGIVAVDLAKGTSRVVVAQPTGDFSVSRDGDFGVSTTQLLGQSGRGRTPALLLNLKDATARPLLSHGLDVTAVALDASGSVVASGSSDGVVRIGSSSGEGEPHLLLGQEGSIRSVVLSPDGRWVAAAGEAFTIRIWPVPDLSTPPLHRRPHDDLISALRSHTNLRAVSDSSSPTGYKLQFGTFPGWAQVPEW